MPAHYGGIFLEVTTGPSLKSFTEMFVMMSFTNSNLIVYALLKTMFDSTKTEISLNDFP